MAIGHGWHGQAEFRISTISMCVRSQLQVQHSESAFYQLSYSGFNEFCGATGLLGMYVVLYPFHLYVCILSAL